MGRPKGNVKSRSTTEGEAKYEVEFSALDHAVQHEGENRNAARHFVYLFVDTCSNTGAGMMARTPHLRQLSLR